MIQRLASLLVLVLVAVPAAAGSALTYVGSWTIGEYIMPEANRTFTAKTGIAFDSIQTQGTGKGLEMVLRGEAELAGVSRSLTPGERKKRFYYQIIGYDAVIVAVRPDNPVTVLTRRQLKDIYAGRIRSWKEVGGPDAPIVCITRVWGEKRGLMVEFQEQVMDGLPYREDRKEVEDQNQQATTLLNEKHGITAMSAVFQRPGLKTLAIEGFSPELRHVRSGAYILSRPLLLVAQAHPRPEVKRFLEFMLGLEGQAIVARHFVPVR